MYSQTWISKSIRAMLGLMRMFLTLDVAQLNACLHSKTLYFLNINHFRECFSSYIEKENTN
jgi:hypothetical protein